MYKIISLIFCVVVSLNSVHGNVEDKIAIMSAMKPIVDECAKKHGVTLEALLAAKASGKIDGIEPCFYSCLNSKGEYDVDNSLVKLKKYISSDDDYAKFSQIGKDCASGSHVNS
ncbi:hypothetical protein HF086_010665 [Spodoptera exigua]|uniref:Uncharacterized protein n=1 Tax=Spodoptera exigua TaxID=7107 RepID=A0A922MHK6_SPOEX|nr:hypothetical protein HF086_010665 [Spodoptera exigua]